MERRIEKLMDVKMLCRKPTELELTTIRLLIEYQFHLNIEDFLRSLADANRILVCFGTTGRIRRLLVDGKMFATLRASDYHVIPHEILAKILHIHIPFPKLRIVVFNEIVDDVIGRNTIFCRHVALCDEELGPGDEALITDENDRLLGVASLRIDCDTIITAIRGPAASVRFWCSEGEGVSTSSRGSPA